MINEDLAKEVISKGVHVTERGVTFAIQMAQMPSRRSMMQGMRGGGMGRGKRRHPGRGRDPLCPRRALHPRADGELFVSGKEPV